jgi:hypothetical protein
MYSDQGKLFLSIIIGFGIATLFRKTCKDKSCFSFKAPPVNDIEDKTYQFNNQCYQFEQKQATCDSTKRIINYA